jgi:hypothetical protein
MMERKIRMITMMLLVWSALYLMVATRAHSAPASIGGAGDCRFGDRQASRIGGTL